MPDDAPNSAVADPALDTLLADAEAVKLDGPHGLPMATDDTVWLLQSGSVELYRSDAQGRQFLFRVAPDEIIYPAWAAAESAGFELLALGQRAELLALPLNEFHRVLASTEAKQPARWLDGWCAALASCLQSSPPGRCRGLEPGAEAALRREENATSDMGCCWVEVTSGSVALLGDVAHSFMPGDVMALPPPLWVQAQSADTQLRIHATTEFCGNGEFPQTIAKFQTHILALRGEQAEHLAAAHSARLRDKSAHEQEKLQGALSNLVGVSVLQAGKADFDGLNTEDPLLTACQLIGRRINVEMVAPPAGRPGRQISDPVAAIAQASRIRHRSVALRETWWRRDNGPLLAFIAEDERPVALLPGRRGRYWLYDPADNSRVELTAARATTLKPLAVSFLPGLPRTALTPRMLWRSVTTGTTGEAALMFVCGLAAGLLGLAVPILSQQLFDEVIPLAERSRLVGITGLLVLFALVAAAFELTRGLAMLRIEALLELRLEAGIMDRLLRLPTRFFRDYQAGDLAMRALGISMARTALSAGVIGALMAGVFSLVNLALLFYYDLKLALLGLALALVAGAVIYGRARIMLGYTREMTAQEGRVSGLLLQLMNGISKLRVAGAEKRAFSVWAEQFAVQKRLAFRSGAVQNHFEVFQAGYPVLGSLLMFAAVYFITEKLSDPAVAQGAAAAGVEALSTGAFIAVIAAFSQFLGGFLGFGMALLGALQAIPLYERAKPILDAVPEVSDDADDPGVLTGEIELSHLQFRYSEIGPLILDDVNLKVRAGQMVALVGPSGSGKSTLLRLLLGLEAPTGGAVYYDGQSLAKLDIDAVRRQIGTVLQKDRAQPGDVFHNIVGQSSNLTLADAWEAARSAGFAEDIEAMPMGMNTHVNDGGTTFSGGQRQRMLIARAIVHKPRILLFDEATSALDNRTQQVVSEALSQLRVTRVVIAHRLSTIEHADCIHVMDAGKIVESGTYAELMARDGLFAQLARRQLA